MPSEYRKQTDPDAWRMVIGINGNGPFLTTRAAAPTMIAAGRGRIVNITMDDATSRRRGLAPCGSSKAALESETIVRAHDLRGTGVTVKGLVPGARRPRA